MKDLLERGELIRGVWESIGDTNEYVARCDAVCANIRIDLGDGQMLHHLVYADDSPSAPIARLGDALRRLGVDDAGLLLFRDRDGTLKTRSLQDFTFSIDDDTLRANGWTLFGDGAKPTSPPAAFRIAGMRLYPDTSILIRAPRDGALDGARARAPSVVGEQQLGRGRE